MISHDETISTSFYILNAKFTYDKFCLNLTCLFHFVHRRICICLSIDECPHIPMSCSERWMLKLPNAMIMSSQLYVHVFPFLSFMFPIVVLVFPKRRSYVLHGPFPRLYPNIPNGIHNAPNRIHFPLISLILRFLIVTKCLI